VEVEVAAFDFPETAVFLEHVYGRKGARSTEVIVRTAWTLQCSGDLGETWREIELPQGMLPARCFTTDSGRHLVQVVESPDVHLFDADWTYLGSRTAGRHQWHGTWSIDQGARGTIMFCEYADLAPLVRVLRSNDDGESWECVFTQPSDETDPAAGVVRHFHTCQADPFLDGRWYLSSGDRESQNGVWYTDDDGLTWTRARPEVGAVEGPELPTWRTANVVRHTAEVILQDAVLWPTDDNLASVARLVRFDKESLSRVDLIASFGTNELRNIVRLDDEHFFVLSESKLDPDRAECYCVRVDGTILGAVSVPNESRARVGFARSLSSKTATGGVFFSFCDLQFDGSPSLLRWAVTLGERSGSETARQRLLGRVNERVQAYGDEDTEVQLLQDSYTRHFQCNVCSAELAEFFVHAPDVYEGVHDPSRFSDEQRVEYPCPHCDSRIRQRTARIVLERFVRNRQGSALLFSTSRPDRRWLARRYRPLTHVSLQGDFGDPQIVSGTDITDMPHIGSDAYDLIYATVVLDYVTNLGAAAREAYRVLRPGGEFAFFIMPYRLVDDDVACVVQNWNALAHEAYAQHADGSETGIPSCVFGIKHIVGTFAQAGFVVETLQVFDPLSLTRQLWFVARKPTPLPPWRALCAPART
jgi:hypothetical protein